MTYLNDLKYWDVSKVENMRGMFGFCENFNADLSNWNVSNVTDMSYMFDGCDSIKELPEWYNEN